MKATQKSRDLPIDGAWAQVLCDTVRQYLAEIALQGGLIQLLGVPFVRFAHSAKRVEGILRRYQHVAFRICERLVRVALERSKPRWTVRWLLGEEQVAISSAVGLGTTLVSPVLSF